MIADFRPISFAIKVNEAKLAAGPAIRRTSAVPGDKPFSIRDKAIGIDPVAHTYIGIAITNTVIMEKRGLLPSTEKKSAGT